MANQWNVTRQIKVGCAAAVLIGLLVMFSANPAIAASGMVVDETSGAPIEGVFVVGRWRGQAPNPVQPDTRCYHIALTKTDSSGRFKLSEPSPSFLLGQRRELSLFKPGYIESADNGAGKQRMKMLKRTPSVEGRFATYNSQLYAGCTRAEEVLVPLIKAIHEEASMIAATDKQKERVIVLKYYLDRAELGEEAAGKLSADARKKLRLGSEQVK